MREKFNRSGESRTTYGITRGSTLYNVSLSCVEFYSFRDARRQIYFCVQPAKKKAMKDEVRLGYREHVRVFLSYRYHLEIGARPQYLTGSWPKDDYSESTAYLLRAAEKYTTAIRIQAVISWVLDTAHSTPVGTLHRRRRSRPVIESICRYVSNGAQEPRPAQGRDLIVDLRNDSREVASTGPRVSVFASRK